jgi:CO/xanthine dehydrogenase FAD-binding subunit
VRGPDLSTVNCAGVLTPDGVLTLVLGAVAETPVRISDLNVKDEDAVVDRVCQAIAPIDDVRGSAEYRLDLACLLVRRMLKRLTGDV